LEFWRPCDRYNRPERTGKEPERLANPVVVQIKDQLWSAIRPRLESLPGQ
jgi:hypothetical protein